MYVNTVLPKRDPGSHRYSGRCLCLKIPMALEKEKVLFEAAINDIVAMNLAEVPLTLGFLNHVKPFGTETSRGSECDSDISSISDPGKPFQDLADHDFEPPIHGLCSATVVSSLVVSITILEDHIKVLIEDEAIEAYLRHRVQISQEILPAICSLLEFAGTVSEQAAKTASLEALEERIHSIQPLVADFKQGFQLSLEFSELNDQVFGEIKESKLRTLELASLGPVIYVLENTLPFLLEQFTLKASKRFPKHVDQLQTVYTRCKTVIVMKQEEQRRIRESNSSGTIETSKTVIAAHDGEKQPGERLSHDRANSGTGLVSPYKKTASATQRPRIRPVSSIPEMRLFHGVKYRPPSTVHRQKLEGTYHKSGQTRAPSNGGSPDAVSEVRKPALPGTSLIHSEGANAESPGPRGLGISQVHRLGNQSTPKINRADKENPHIKVLNSRIRPPTLIVERKISGPRPSHILKESGSKANLVSQVKSPTQILSKPQSPQLSIEQSPQYSRNGVPTPAPRRQRLCESPLGRSSPDTSAIETPLSRRSRHTFSEPATMLNIRRLRPRRITEITEY